MRQPEVARLVAERLKLVGLSRQQLDVACAKVREVSWRRLPLYTEAVLEGAPLQPLLQFKTDVDLSTFVGVYEEFLAGFITTTELQRHGALSWLTSKLKLSRLHALQLFGTSERKGRRGVHPREMLPMVAALAALADYTYVGERYSDFVSFTTKVDQYQFGILGGRPVTNLRAAVNPPRLAQYVCRTGLQHHGRNTIVAREESTTSLFAQLNAWAHAEPELLGGDRPGFLLALNMLRFRNPYGPGSAGMQEAIIGRADPEAFRQAIRLASGFDDFDDPYRELRALLVPAFVKADEFSRLFGHCRPGQRPSLENQQRWRIALDNLVESLQEAA